MRNPHQIDLTMAETFYFQIELICVLTATKVLYSWSWADVMVWISNHARTKAADVYIKVLFMLNVRLTDVQKVFIYKDITYRNKQFQNMLWYHFADGDFVCRLKLLDCALRNKLRNKLRNNQISIAIHAFSLKKMRLISSAKWRPICFGLNVWKVVLVSFVCSGDKHAAAQCWMTHPWLTWVVIHESRRPITCVHSMW